MSLRDGVSERAYRGNKFESSLCLMVELGMTLENLVGIAIVFQEQSRRSVVLR